MRRRSFLTMGGAAGLALAMPGVASAAVAAPGRTRAATGRHDFGSPGSLRDLAAPIGLHIGTAVIPFDLDTPAYAAILAEQFSAVTPGNAMEWGVVEPVQGQFDWSDADTLVSFAEQHGQLVRGHTLLWHNQLPDWLTTGVANGTISSSQLMSLLEAHIFTEMGRYRGKIWQWDVANEFFLDANPSGINPNDFWVSNLGPGVIPQAFKWAREADPHALLIYNDYNIAGEDGTNAKSDAVYAWLQQMLDQGGPIDGVGDQGHLDTQFGFSGSQMTQDFQRYATLGLKVAITEADVRTFVNNATDQVPTDNLAVFAQPYEFGQMLKAALAGPGCISFTVWASGTRTPGCPASSPARDTPRSTTWTSSEKRLLRTAAGPSTGRLRRAAPVLRPPRPLAVSRPSPGRLPLGRRDSAVAAAAVGRERPPRPARGSRPWPAGPRTS